MDKQQKDDEKNQTASSTNEWQGEVSTPIVSDQKLDVEKTKVVKETPVKEEITPKVLNYTEKKGPPLPDPKKVKKEKPSIFDRLGQKKQPIEDPLKPAKNLATVQSPVKDEPEISEHVLMTEQSNVVDSEFSDGTANVQQNISAEPDLPVQPAQVAQPIQQAQVAQPVQPSQTVSDKTDTSTVEAETGAVVPEQTNQVIPPGDLETVSPVEVAPVVAEAEEVVAPEIPQSQEIDPANTVVEPISNGLPKVPVVEENTDDLSNVPEAKVETSPVEEVPAVEQVELPTNEELPEVKVKSAAEDVEKQPENIAYELSPESSLDDLLSYTIDKEASDLHISVGYPPIVRIDGDLMRLPLPALSQDRVEQMMMDVLSSEQKESLAKDLDIDFSYAHPSSNRFRVNIFYRQGMLAGAFRLIPYRIRSVSELGLPPLMHDFIDVANGLVLVTGPTGSGKSTTLAAVINEINMTHPKHIITLEDPIEYVFPKSKALLNQRELGLDVRNWKRGLREVLREDPDVVLVGEMRDFDTIALTITTAETGHLVFSTLHTNSASQTIDRIIDVFPEAQQSQIRAQLANVIHAVVAQRLIPVKSGGRRAVNEVMLATPAIRNAIREKKTYQIDNMIQTSSELGMFSLESSLVKLIRQGEITIEEAQAYTTKHSDLISLLKQN